jgi:hypothetical protein
MSDYFSPRTKRAASGHEAALFLSTAEKGRKNKNLSIQSKIHTQGLPVTDNKTVMGGFLIG